MKTINVNITIPNTCKKTIQECPYLNLSYYMPNLSDAKYFCQLFRKLLKTKKGNKPPCAVIPCKQCIKAKNENN